MVPFWANHNPGDGTNHPASFLADNRRKEELLNYAGSFLAPLGFEPVTPPEFWSNFSMRALSLSFPGKK
jgi:hypothetical protein